MNSLELRIAKLEAGRMQKKMRLPTLVYSITDKEGKDNGGYQIASLVKFGVYRKPSVTELAILKSLKR